MEIIQLIEKIIDSDNWPYFSDADRLDELDELAEEAFRRKTFDGFLSYVFITHQICDELLKLLSDVTQFLFFVIARRLLEWPSNTVWFSMCGSSSDVLCANIRLETRHTAP